jgi:hypothetical protein
VHVLIDVEKTAVQKNLKLFFFGLETYADATLHVRERCRQHNTWNTKTKKKLNPVVVVLKRTIPIERPPLVGEVSANLCG